MYAVMYYRKSGNNLYQNTRIGTKKSVNIHAASIEG